MNCQELTDSISNIKTQLTELDGFVNARKPDEAIRIKNQIGGELDKHELKIGYRYEKAKKILDQDFLGPEEIKAVFCLESIEVPPIPFSIKDLRRAKVLGQFLILRTNEIPDDKRKLPHTRQTLREAPETRWALVTKELVHDSTNKTYLEQTERIIKYLEEEVFSGCGLPPEYKSAAEDFRGQKEKLKKLSKSSDITKQLSKLLITQLTRQSCEEILYDLEVYRAITGQYLLPSGHWARTTSHASSGLQLGVGVFASDGVSIHGFGPDYSYPNFGAVFSRSQ